MTVFKESTLAYEALLSESPGYISRNVVTVKSGSGVIKACTVLGKITATGKYVPSSATATDGSEKACAISLAEADSTGKDVEITAIVQAAEVARSMLNYDKSITSAELIQTKLSQLETVGILAR